MPEPSKKLADLADKIESIASKYGMQAMDHTLEEAEKLAQGEYDDSPEEIKLVIESAVVAGMLSVMEELWLATRKNGSRGEFLAILRAYSER